MKYCGDSQGDGILAKEGKQATPNRIASVSASMANFAQFALLGSLALSGGLAVRGRGQPATDRFPSRGQTAAQQEARGSTHPTTLPRGKKLILKDGNFQLVRSYERNGERVRYFSAERGDWEEIPAAMVDWEATAKAEAEEEKAEAELTAKVHKQEVQTKAEIVMDIDASLQVATGVFLPPGEGMFVIEGKSVTALEQAGSQVKMDKKRFIQQALSPIPIIPSKHHVEIAGAKAKMRITNEQPEFYLREAPPDPDRTTPIQKSSRPGESGPEVELVRATVKGNSRQLETIRSLFGEEISQERNTISLQRWDVAPTVFRFTLSETLPPGEYALAEILPDGMNLYVWDFGVDGPATGKTVKH
jgi:hypothetical protein